MSDDILLKVDHLKTYFPVRKNRAGKETPFLKAVDDISFQIKRGQTLGLVGETGCGKTTVGKSILRLIPATQGAVYFDNRNVFRQSTGSMRKLRREMQLIFQDPYGSLNPRMTVDRIIGEAMQVHRMARGRKLRERINELLHQVGLSPQHAGRYPHEFSGGQRQRIGIARALALNPRFIVCDEPVSALDVSIQSQIINLLQELQQQLGLTYLFIAHDLAVVEYISDYVAVMYLGRIVEYARAKDLYGDPKHPYTMALLSAIPQPCPDRERKRIVLSGESPSPVNTPAGCPFHPRCFMKTERCTIKKPELTPKGDQADHLAACWETK